MQADYDVLGIGNAIVDVIAHADDDFLVRHGLSKGTMTLIDEEAANRLYAAMNPAIECSGGSAANTIACIASLDGAGAFIGKVRDDQLGTIFRHDIRALGVRFDTPPAPDGLPTARCLVLVTPDAQRTLQTFLGACTDLTPADIEPDVVAAASITYLEGYLWDPPQAKLAFEAAARHAHAARREVALSLSDPFCVDRHRQEFRRLLNEHVDILFANEQEIMSLYQVRTFDDALQQVRGACKIAALTRSARGSVVVRAGEVHVVDAAPVDQVVDTTGAGDAYAGGFLFAYARGAGLAEAARVGSIAAAEVISHVGARPESPLAALVPEAGQQPPG